MNQQIDIAEKTFNFSVRIVNLCKILDEKPGVEEVLYNQLLRSGTLIGLNVEESQSCQSKAEFISKLEAALNEANKSRYWLRILIATNVIDEHKILPLLGENEEINRAIETILKNL